MAETIGVMDLLARLRQSGGELQLDGDKLRLRAPKGALPDDLRAALAARRDEIVEFLRRAQGGEFPPPRRRSAAPPATATCRSPSPRSGSGSSTAWRRGAPPTTSRSPCACAAARAGGPGAALGEVVRRHEALRTTFAERGGEPVQVIAPPAPLAAAAR